MSPGRMKAANAIVGKVKTMTEEGLVLKTDITKAVGIEETEEVATTKTVIVMAATGRIGPSLEIETRDPGLGLEIGIENQKNTKIRQMMKDGRI